MLLHNTLALKTSQFSPNTCFSDLRCKHYILKYTRKNKQLSAYMWNIIRSITILISLLFDDAKFRYDIIAFIEKPKQSLADGFKFKNIDIVMFFTITAVLIYLLKVTMCSI